MKPNFLTIDPEEDINVLKGLASPIRIRILKLLRSEGRLNVNDISHQPRPAAVDRCDQRADAGRGGADRDRGGQGQERPPEDLLGPFRRDHRAVRDRRAAARSGCGRSGDAARPVHFRRGRRAVRSVLDRWRDRPSRRSRLLPRPCPRAGRADLVRARQRRIQIPQQRQAAQRRRRVDRVLHGAVVGNARHQHGLAVRHHAVGQRCFDRHMDIAWRLWRQARGLHAELVEARGFAVRQAQDLADQPVRLLHRRRPHFRHDDGRHRHPQASLDPHADRHRCQGGASRSA